MLESFLSALIVFGVLINPLGHAAMFAALTEGRPPQEVRSIARRSALIAFSVLFAFGFLGAWLLRQIGITLDAFRIAGGILLFTLAFRILMGHHDRESISAKSSVYANMNGDISVFPLAIPLLAGPGAMTAIILLMGKVQHWTQGLGVYLALLAAMIVAYVCMAMVERIKKLMGPSGILIITRLMGILLAALAIQFIVDGLHGFMPAAVPVPPAVLAK
jgi:multiple antibiotic resistance protein